MSLIFDPSSSSGTDESLKSSFGLNWVFYHFTGDQVADFLHRLSTVDVKNMQLGEIKPGCFLSPQGKVRAWFCLVRLDQNEFGFEMDLGQSGFWENEFKAFIDQYTFSEKLTLTDPSIKLKCLWLFSKASEVTESVLASVTPGTTAVIDGVRVIHHGTKDYGRNWISLWALSDPLSQWTDKNLPNSQRVDLQQVERWRIEATRPRVDYEMTPSCMPVEVGITDTIAKNKGCYPGQEVIEKVISLGSPARRLCRLDLGSNFKVGWLELGSHESIVLTNLAEPGIEVGELTSLSLVPGEGNESDAGYLALAMIRKIHAKPGLEVKAKSNPSLEGNVFSIQQIAPFDS